MLLFLELFGELPGQAASRPFRPGSGMGCGVPLFPGAVGPDRLGQRPWDGEASRTGRGGQALKLLFPHCLRPRLCPGGVPKCGSSGGRLWVLGSEPWPCGPRQSTPSSQPPFPQWGLDTPPLSTQSTQE